MAADNAFWIPREINVCFYGLNRSLSKTHESIENHLIQPLRQLDIVVNIHACFVRANGPIHNPRSGEVDSEAESSEQTLLTDAVIRYMDQETVDTLIDWGLIFSLGDLFGDAQLEDSVSPSGSICNAIRALSSLRAVQDMIPQDKRNNPCIFVRPDLDILAPLAWPAIFSALAAREARHAYGDSEGTIVVPSWHRWDGVNDRFAVCSAGQATTAYANRINHLSEYLQISCTAFHPESFLLHVLMMRRIQIMPVIDTPMVRVRCGGRIHNEDFSAGSQQWSYPSAAWQSIIQLNQQLAARLQQAKSDLQNPPGSQTLSLELDRLQKELQRTQASLEQAETELKQCRNVETELTDARSALVQQQRLQQALQQDLGEGRREKERRRALEQELKVAGTALEDLRALQGELHQQLEETRSTLHRALEERKQFEQDLIQARAEAGQRHAQAEQLQNALETARRLERHQAERSSDQEQAWQQRVAGLERELAEARSENALLLEELCCAQERLGDAESGAKPGMDRGDVDAATINANRSSLLAPC
jgi:hypothetical protein